MAAKQEQRPRVILAPGGLRLTFSRDLASKYRPESRTRGDGERLKQLLEAVGTWRVSGYYDFLQIRPFSCLDRLHDVSQEEERDSSWRSFSDLVLVPLTTYPVDDRFVNRLEQPNRDSCGPDPMLVVIKIILNPAIYESGASPDSTLEVIGNAIDLLKRWIEGEVDGGSRPGRFPVGYFASLSGPDLAVVALPRTPIQLWLMHRLVRRARTLLLNEIACVMPGIPDGGPAVAALPGHACASVEPSLAFSKHASSCFRTEEFTSGEAFTGLRLGFRIRPDCGHEDEVVTSLQKHCENRVIVPGCDRKDDGRLRTSWSNYAVEGHFLNLADFVTAFDSLWFASPKGSNESSWREKHLIQSVTTASFFDQPSDNCPSAQIHSERVWTLDDKVLERLDQVFTNLQSFSKSFLNESQRAELMSIYLSFRSCLFRHELLGPARDLYPFFLQLGNMFSLEDYWKKYLERPSSGQGDCEEALRHSTRFNNDLQALFVHTNRAVRNRVEHRSTQGDPPVAHTLGHGACKLVNAYSSVFWLATQLFRGPDAGVCTAPGDTRFFAAAVAAGSCGRVECDELFSDFRRFVEANGSGAQETGGCKPTISIPTNSLSLRGPQGWSARLLTLDISGTALLRPELCFVHCLHEVAELSEWLELAASEPIRRALNQWVIEEAAWALSYAVAKAAFAHEEKPRASETNERLRIVVDELHRFSVGCTLLSAASYGLGDAAPHNAREVMERVRGLIPRPHPTALLDGLDAALEDLAQDLERERKSKGSHRIQNVLCDIISQPILPRRWTYIEEGVRTDAFDNGINTVRELIPEVIGDIGMWCALDHVLADGHSRSQAERRRDLNRVFQSLLVAVAESHAFDGSRPRLNQMVLHRWAIQAAAMCEPARNWQSTIIEAVTELNRRLEVTTSSLRVMKPCEVNEYLVRIVNIDPQFAERDSLVAHLRELPFYGERDSVKAVNVFPELETLDDRDRDLLAAFRSAWKCAAPTDDPTWVNPESIDFVFRLWASSGRFGMMPFLRELETGPECAGEPV